MASALEIEAQLFTFINNDVIDVGETTSVTSVRYYESSNSAPLDVYQVTSVSENLKLYLVFENGALISRKGFSNLKDTTGIAEGGTLEGHFETFYANYGDVTQSVVSEFETFFATNLAVVSDLRVTNSIAGSTDGLEVFDITLSTGKHVWLIFDDETDELVGYYRLDRISDLNAQNDFSQVADIFNIWYSSEDVTTEVQAFWDNSGGLTVTGNAAQYFRDEENQTDTITINVDTVSFGTYPLITQALEIVIVFNDQGVLQSSTGLIDIANASNGQLALSTLEAGMNTWYSNVSANNTPDETWNDSAGIAHEQYILVDDATTMKINEKTALGTDLIYEVDRTDLSLPATITGTLVTSTGATFTNLSATATFDPTADNGDGNLINVDGTATTSTNETATFKGNDNNDGFVITYTDAKSVLQTIEVNDDLVETSTTLISNTAPTLISSTPADDATMDSDANIVLTFSEDVQVGTGDIIIKKDDGTPVKTIDVASTSVTFNGTTVTIDPTQDFVDGKGYYVEIASGVIIDTATTPIAFAGISGQDLNFTTNAATANQPVEVASDAPNLIAGDTTGSFTVDASAFFTDTSDDTLTYSLTNSSDTGYTVDTNTGIVTVNSTVEDGTIYIDITATDTSDATANHGANTVFKDAAMTSKVNDLFTSLGISTTNLMVNHGSSYGGEPILRIFADSFADTDNNFTGPGDIDFRITYDQSTGVSYFGSYGLFDFGGYDMASTLYKTHFTDWITNNFTTPTNTTTGPCVVEFHAIDDGPANGDISSSITYANSVAELAAFKAQLTTDGTIGDLQVVDFEQDNGWGFGNFAGATTTYDNTTHVPTGANAYVSAPLNNTGDGGSGDASGSLVWNGSHTDLSSIDVRFDLINTSGNSTHVDNPGIGRIDGSDDMDRGFSTTETTTPSDQFTQGQWLEFDSTEKFGSEGSLVVTFQFPVEAVGFYLLGREDGKDDVTITLGMADGTFQSPTSGAVVPTGDTTTAGTNLSDGSTQFYGFVSNDSDDPACVIQTITIKQPHLSQRDIISIDDLQFVAANTSTFSNYVIDVTNSAPSVPNPITSGAPIAADIPDMHYAIGESKTLNPNNFFYDPDGDALTYTVKFPGSNDEIPLQTWLDAPIPSDATGTYAMTIVASDGTNTTEKSFNVVIENFDSDQNMIEDSVAAYFYMMGMTNFEDSLSVSATFNEATDTDIFDITVDRFTFNTNLDTTGINLHLEFDNTDKLTANSSGLDATNLVDIGINATGVEQWYQYADPDNFSAYELESVEDLFAFVGINNYKDLDVGVVDVVNGETFTIKVTEFSDGATTHNWPVDDLVLTFVNDAFVADQSTIPSAYSSVINSTVLGLWFDKSNPDSKMQEDQRDDGYLDNDQSGGDAGTTYDMGEYNYTDHEGVTWYVAEQEVAGVWSKTETSTEGDTRVFSNSWNQATQENTFTEVFKTSDNSIDYTRAEVSSPSGTIITHTGKTDHIGWNPLNGVYEITAPGIVEKLDINWQTLSVTGSATNSNSESVDIGWDANSWQLTIDGQAVFDNASGGFDNFFDDSKDNTYEWTDWDGTVWKVEEKDVSGTWTTTETAYDATGTATGDIREFSSSWDDNGTSNDYSDDISVWTEKWTDSNGTSTRTETQSSTGTTIVTSGMTDHAGWMYLGDFYDMVSLTETMDANWNTADISGTGYKVVDGVTSATLSTFTWDAITWQLSVDGIPISGDAPQDSGSGGYVQQDWTSEPWTWEDGNGIVWEVIDEQVGETWSSSQTAYNGYVDTDNKGTATGDVRISSSTWDDDEKTNTWSETTVIASQNLNFKVTEIFDEDNGTSQTITETLGNTDGTQGGADRIGWMPLDGIYVELSVTEERDNNWVTTSLTGSGKKDNGDGTFTNTDFNMQADDWGYQITMDIDDGNGPQAYDPWGDPQQNTQQDQNYVDDVTPQVQDFFNAAGISVTNLNATKVEDSYADTETYTIVADGLSIELMFQDSTDTFIDSTENSTNIDALVAYASNISDASALKSALNNWYGDTYDSNDVGYSNSWSWQDDYQQIVWVIEDQDINGTWVSTETGYTLASFVDIDNPGTATGDVRKMTNEWNESSNSSIFTEEFTSSDGNLDFKRVETYDDNSTPNDYTDDSSTVVITGKDDHLGWEYLGESFTSMNVTLVRDENWNTTSISGTGVNADGDTVEFGYDDGQITVDGDSINSNQDYGDQSKSGDNFEFTWDYYDEMGVQWTVKDSQDGDWWKSVETSSNGDVRFNKSKWSEFGEDDNDDGYVNSTDKDVTIDGTTYAVDNGAYSKLVSKYKSAETDANGDPVSKYKMVEKWYDNYKGTNEQRSVMEVKGTTDMLGWDYLGEVYSDIDFKIIRDGNWNIQKIVAASNDVSNASAVNEAGTTVYFHSNNNEIFITEDATLVDKGRSIYQMNDDFFDFGDGGNADEFKMENDQWEYSYQDNSGNNVEVVDKNTATDIITITADSYNSESESLKIAIVYDLDSESVASIVGVPDGVTGFDKASIEAWYKADVLNFAPTGGWEATDADAQEQAFIKTEVSNYFTSVSLVTTNLDTTFDINDQWVTTENTIDNDVITKVVVRTRSESIGTETEREDHYETDGNSTAVDKHNAGTPSSWVERSMTFEDNTSGGYSMIQAITSSRDEDMVRTETYNEDGTTTITNKGDIWFGDMLVKGAEITEQLDQYWNITDYSGTSEIPGEFMNNFGGTGFGLSNLGATEENTQVLIGFEGVGVYGEAQLKFTIYATEAIAGLSASAGDILTWPTGTADAGEQMIMTNYQEQGDSTLNEYALVDGDSYSTSRQDWVWNQDGFTPGDKALVDTDIVSKFTGTQSDKPSETITITETKQVNSEGNITSLKHYIVTSKGEDYTIVFNEIDRADAKYNYREGVELLFDGDKKYLDELYKNVDVDKFVDMHSGDVSINGTATALDGSDIEIFKPEDQRKIEIIKISRDGQQQRITEDDAAADHVEFYEVEQVERSNEIYQWNYTDPVSNVKWDVVDKYDGETWSSTEIGKHDNGSGIDAGTRTVVDTWDDNGGSSIFTESLIDSAGIAQAVVVETRGFTSDYTAGVFKDIQTVSITKDGVIVADYTETMTFNDDANTLERDIEGDKYHFNGQNYTNVDINEVRDASTWVIKSLTGTVELDGAPVTVGYQGTNSWGDPILTFDGVSDTSDSSNENPSAVVDSLTLDKNESATIDVVANDADNDGDSLSVKSVGEATNGKVFLLNGEVAYMPNYNYSGSDSFSYVVTDGRGGSDTGTVDVTVTNTNKAVVAVADNFTIEQGSLAVVLDLTANDTDADGDTISVASIETTGTKGTVSLDLGVVTYKPTDGFAGKDTFTYTVEDTVAAGLDKTTSTETVTVMVEALNSAPTVVEDADLVGANAMAEDTTIQIDVLANDSDIDGDTLTIHSVGNAAHGTVKLMMGYVFYTPDANYVGDDDYTSGDASTYDDTFTYVAMDSQGAKTTGIVSLMIDAKNDAPVTVTDVVTLEENSATLTIDVLGNDSDAENDALTISSIGTAAHGTVAIVGDKVTYTPEADYTGTDSFTYVATDALAKTIGTVTVTVSETNADPITIEDVEVVTEDSAAVSNKFSVLTNDTDPNGNILALDSISTALYGTATIAGNNILYAPDANYEGSDTITYTVTDGNGGSAKGTVTITVRGANDAPEAIDDVLGSVSTSKGVVKLDVLANDYDIDTNDSISIQSVATSASSTTDAEFGATATTALGNRVSIANGKVTYTASTVSNGSDSFDYLIVDESGKLDYATATLTLSNNTNPVAINDEKEILEDASATEITVLSNDLDVDSDKVQIHKISTDPTYGSATVTNGKLFYTPNVNYTGTDTFAYIVKDGKSGFDEATVTITITAVNDDPSARNDNATVEVDTSANIIDVLGNDSDADGDTLTVTAVGNSGASTHGGVVALSMSGVVTYTPKAGFTGSDSFTYTVSDDASSPATATATVNITVAALNTVPVANNVTYATAITEDSKDTIIDLSGEYADSVDASDTVSIVSITQADHGTVKFTNGKVLYTPDKDYEGIDTFTYTVDDGNDGQDSGIVTLTVDDIEDAAVAVNDDLGDILSNARRIKVDLLSNDTDADDDEIGIIAEGADVGITAVGNAKYGSVSLVNGEVYYTPGEKEGTDVFTYTLTGGDEGTAKVNVVAANNEATGSVSVNGATQTGQTLTASNTLADDDGIGNVSYQWYRDGVAIDNPSDGAYSVTASLISSDNTQLAVVDPVTGKQSLNSEPIVTLAGVDYYAFKSIDSGTGSLSSSITFDFANLELTYLDTMDADTAVSTEIYTGTDFNLYLGSTKVATGSDVEVTAVTDSDGVGTGRMVVTLTSTADDTTGVVNSLTTVQSGKSQIILDIDGFASASVVSPSRSADNKADYNLTGNLTTSDTYKLTLEDAGSSFTVKASYTDDNGNFESVTSSVTDAIVQMDAPFSFVPTTVADASSVSSLAGYAYDSSAEFVKLTLHLDIDKIYSRTDVTSITGADLSLNLDWTQFDALGSNSDNKFVINKVGGNLIALNSSSDDATNATFDTLALASTRTSEPLLTIVDTDVNNDSTGITTTTDLIEVYVRPSAITSKISAELSGTISANQGQLTFSQYDSTVSNINAVAGNSAATGSVSVSGTMAVDEELTASHTLADEDGMGVVSYQWLRDGADIDGATNDVYTLLTADINKAISVKASFTDVALNKEEVTSSASNLIQSTDNKPLMFTSELISASKASIEAYGADYSLDPDETLIKLILEADMARFTDSSITSIAGAELSFDVDWNNFENLTFAGGHELLFSEKVNYEGSMFKGVVTDDTTGQIERIVLSSLNTATKPLLTLVDTVATAAGEVEVKSVEKLITFYLNPKDTVKDFELVYSGQIITDQGNSEFTQLSHSLEVEAKSYDAIVSTEATKGLTDAIINLWDNGVDTTKSVIVDAGEISIAETVTFDEVKLTTTTDAYDFDVTISDAIAVLRDIVDLDVLTGNAFYAADVNNDSNITISDAIAVLRDIVDLETIDTFAIIDSNGERVTELNANSTSAAPTWTIVPHGDVNMSGSFDSDYIAVLDIT